MRLSDVEALAELLMELHGIKQKGWKFQFDRSVRRFGLCRHGRQTISLSKHLAQLNDEAEVEDTILHEIAHALVGPGNGHNAVWKAMCVKIGAKPKRCYDSSTVKAPKAKYLMICPKCGISGTRNRLPRDCRTYSCARCSNGKFNPAYILKFVENTDNTYTFEKPAEQAA
jgi:predicted SprT family Zn-dependent metalloprotease